MTITITLTFLINNITYSHSNLISNLIYLNIMFYFISNHFSIKFKSLKKIIRFRRLLIINITNCMVHLTIFYLSLLHPHPFHIIHWSIKWMFTSYLLNILTNILRKKSLSIIDQPKNNGELADYTCVYNQYVCASVCIRCTIRVCYVYVPYAYSRIRMNRYIKSFIKLNCTDRY